MMAEHTPGPWWLDTVTSKDGLLTGDTAIVGGPDRLFLATVWTGKRRPTPMADARLIAAAPDLLAACLGRPVEGRSIFRWLDDVWFTGSSTEDGPPPTVDELAAVLGPYFAGIRAAVAKAQPAPANRRRDAMGLTIPPGYHLYPGVCPDCRRTLVEVDRLEGLPIFGCPTGCGRPAPAPLEDR